MTSYKDLFYPGLVPPTMVHIVLLALLGQSLLCSAIKVTAPDLMYVRQDQKNVRLLCKSDEKIRGCSFQTPYGKIYSDLSDGIYADHKRLQHITEEQGMDCGISILQINEKDAGDWECIMSLRVDGESVTESGKITLAFAKAPSTVALEPPFDEENVTISEGNKTDVKCIAKHAKAKPTFKWFLGGEDYNVEGKIQDFELKIDEPNAEPDVFHYQQVLTYEPELGHNGKKLKCVVQHIGLEDERFAEALIIVPKPEEIEESSLSPGATVGIVIAVLILLSIVTTVFLIWRIKTSKEKDDEEVGTDAEKIALDGGMEQEEYEEDEKKAAAKQGLQEISKQKIAGSKEDVASEKAEPTLIQKKEEAAASAPSPAPAPAPAPATAPTPAPAPVTPAPQVKASEEKAEEPAKEEPKMESEADKGEKEKEKVEDESKPETKEDKGTDAS